MAFFALPETVLLCLSLVFLVVSPLFEWIAVHTQKIDESTVAAIATAEEQEPGAEALDRAREQVLMFGRDLVWRVTFLTSAVASLVAVVILLSTAVGVQGWFIVLALLGVLAIVAFMLAKSDPYALLEPWEGYGPVTWYRLTTTGLVVLQVVIIGLHYSRWPG